MAAACSTQRALLVLLAALALAALSGAAGQAEAQAQARVTVQTTVTEELFMYHNFPNWSVDRQLTQKIPFEKGVLPANQLR